MCSTLIFLRKSTTHKGAVEGGERTCAKAFRAIDKYERDDGEVPFRFNLIVVF
jgi:hypothetical protein